MATVAVTGAAGKTGQAVTAHLAAAWTVVGLARNEAQARRLQADGHRTVVGDLRDRHTVERLCDGVDAIYHICPNFSADELAIGTLVAEAASGVDRFVYHSVLHPQTEDMPHHWRKLRVEELLLRERPGAVTFLRPAPYVQNLVPYVADALETGELHMPYSVDTPTAMVDLADVGRAAAAVLSDAVEPGSGWDLAGVGSISHRDVAERLSDLAGRPIGAVEVEPDAAPASDLDRMFAYMHEHGLAASTGQLRALIGEPTPLDVSLRHILEAQAVVAP